MHRFVLRMRNAAWRDGMPRLPQFYGGALILGDNPVATALADRLRTHDVDVKTLSIAGGPANSGGGGDLDAELDRIWASAWTPHLFVTTPHDPAAAWFSTDVDGCKKRLPVGLHAVYRVAQRWMTHAVDQNRMSEASLMSLICGGGDFGFQDASPLHRTSAESGGIAGLTKAMSIEAWMRGYRETPMRVIDSPPGTPPRAIIEGMFREWATPSHDLEATVYEPANRTHELANGMENQSALARRVPMAMHRPLTNRPQAKSRPPENRPLAKSQVDNVPLTPGGVWIVAGGGRGITAFVAMELAKRYDLKLRMLGMAPKPEIDSQTHDHAVSDLPGLRRLKFAQWTKAGENPVRRWRHFEKALEIHRTLLECQRANIDAKYCSVDVSDVAAVADACEQIRRQNGAIRGVIQGAGSGQDARFDRKRVDKVRQCLSAKIDGTAALAAATQHDALEWFIGFGSISGRFGANGHTDYSAANDMMAKMIGRLGRERPATRCVTFHWHAWGDVGMATKPEAKLALDLIGMDFMPAAEGLQHFLDEIESGGDEAEVLITDRKYVRKFFPSQVIGKQAIAPEQLGERLLPPLLDPHGVHPAGESQDRQRFQATFDANVDPFLKEHRVGGRATLPMAIAIECFAEASFGPRRFDDEATRVLTNIRAHHPLKPLEDHAFAIEVVRDGQSSGETDAARWHLVSDLRRRDGRLVQAARTYFEATSTLESASTLESTSTRALDRQGTPSGLATNWHTLIYADESAPVYHGPPLRCLRRAGWSDPSTREIWLGQIVARSPLELAGHWRPLTGWVLDPAVLDAVFYAVGMYAIETCQRPSLPVSIGRLEMGRRPDPGEVLRVEVRRGNSLLQQQGGTIVDATLWGQNGDRLLRLVDYRVAWLLENAFQTSFR